MENIVKFVVPQALRSQNQRYQRITDRDVCTQKYTCGKSYEQFPQYQLILELNLRPHLQEK